MRSVNYKDDIITIYEFDDAKKLIMQLSDRYAGDVTPVSRGGRGRN